MRSLLDALYAERRALAGCFVLLLGTALIAAALMHLAERAAQPERFGTIPDALWWAIVTLGTIGYGDAVPVTALGRVLAGFTIFAGLLMMALPVGIFATCVYRNLNPNVLTMKSAQYGARTYDAGSLNRTRDRRILVQ